MTKFNKEYVHFMRDGNLCGKYGYFADNIDSLRRFVIKDAGLPFFGKLSYDESTNDSFPFVKEVDNKHYRFFYFDPSFPQVPNHARRATNREFALWLAHGNGEACYFNKVTASDCFTEFRYHPDYADDLVSTSHTGSRLMVRRWSDTEWHEPTIDYLGLKE